MANAARGEGTRTLSARAEAWPEPMGDNDEQDRFHIDPSIIPDGMSYEWKRKSTLEKEDREHQVEMHRQAWRPVPAERHADRFFVPGEKVPDTIERSGMILMERPAKFTERARARAYNRAVGQVGDKLAQIGQTPRGDEGKFNRTAAVHKREYTPMEIPE